MTWQHRTRRRAWWHQQEAIFRRGSRRLLESGVVVALEPFLAHWHCQDLIPDH